MNQPLPDHIASNMSDAEFLRMLDDSSAPRYLFERFSDIPVLRQLEETYDEDAPAERDRANATIRLYEHRIIEVRDHFKRIMSELEALSDRIKGLEDVE